MNRTRKDIEEMQVSFFLKKEASKYCDMSIGRVLCGIANGAYNKEVSEAREYLFEEDIEEYNRIKLSLPAVAFCGTFKNGHKAEECTHYNSLMVVDIDKLNELEMITVVEILKYEPCIAAFWLSPSGRGYKGLVHLNYDEIKQELSQKEKHYMAFRQLFKYLFAEYNIELDGSGKDISRLCFMSSDSSICIKEEAKAFDVQPENDVVPTKNKKMTTTPNFVVTPKNWNEVCGKATGYKANIYNRSLIAFLLKKLKKKGLSITDTWENWTKVAFAIASSVHPEMGKKLFLELCRLDGDKHDETKSEQLIWDAYIQNKGKCSINTIKYLAGQKGIVLDK